MGILDRIMKKVVVCDKPHPILGTPCWEWTGGTKNGYGTILVDGKQCYVHRVMYRIKRGDLTKPNVCHHCDNPICCNPDHMFLGTHADNVADCVAKKRHAFGDKNGIKKDPSKASHGEAHYLRRDPSKSLTGDKHGNTKFTEEVVRQMFAMKGTMTQRKIAAAFGISEQHLSGIFNGRWRKRG